MIDSNEADKSLSKVDERAEKVGGTLGSTIGTAAKVGAAIVAGAVAGGAAIYSLSSKAAEYSGNILDASRKSSLTMENLQQLKYAGEQAGVSFENLVGSTVKLNKNFAEAISGNKAAANAFSELGVSIRDAGGNARTTNDVYNDTLMRLAQMGDTTEATRLGTELFGKGFANLKPLLGEGAGGIEDLKKKASELGIVLDDEAIVAGDNFGDTMDSLKAALGGVGNVIGIQFMPILQGLADWIIQHMPEIKAVMKVVFDTIGDAVSLVYRILKQLYEWVEPYLPAMGAIIKGAFQIAIDIIDTTIGAISKVIDWFKKGIDIAKNFVKAMKESRASGAETTSARISNYGYASGTEYASSGLHWVGEEGPELLNFRGGEQVIPNDAIFLNPSRSMKMQIINQGTVVGANGMKEFAKMVSSEIANEFGLSLGGVW